MRQWKKRIYAMLLATAMTLGTVAIAAGTEKTISVTPMALNINGQTVTPTKSDGTDAEVFSYNGATYVPLRYLSELLGIEVNWDPQAPNTAKLVGVPGVAATSFTPGTYTAESKGMDGLVKLQVTVSANAITEIKILEQNETAGVCEKVYELLPAEIVRYQSLNVDSVSGATITSNAVKMAVRDALTQAGGDVNALAKVPVPSKVEDGEYEYDVVVVGGGLAGLSAAVEAYETGAKVALIEKEGILGGTSLFSSGGFTCAPTDADVDTMYKGWQNSHSQQKNNTLELDMVRALCEASPRVVNMMSIAGVKHQISQFGANPGNSFVPSATEEATANAESIKMPSVKASAKGGQQTIKALSAYLEKNGVDIYLNTPATSLLTDSKGTVTGVVSETEKFGTKTFHSGAVVLACGDYAQNREMCKEICYDAKDNFTSTGIGNTGDGIRMALEVGGVLDEFQEEMSGTFDIDPYDMPVVGQFRNSYPFDGILLTMDGRRVFAEDTSNSHYQCIYYIRDEGPNAAWCVMDQEIAETIPRLDEFMKATENGSSYIKVYKADTLEELAKVTEMDLDTLKATVERYNSLCKSGKDTDFGKDPSFLKTIEAPYYAALCYDCTRGNYGGIVTDTKASVVKADGSPIGGLYAAGVISSGAFYGDLYPGGQALAVSSHMGFIAGENAAKYALK